MISRVLFYYENSKEKISFLSKTDDNLLSAADSSYFCRDIAIVNTAITQYEDSFVFYKIVTNRSVSVLFASYTWPTLYNILFSKHFQRG